MLLIFPFSLTNNNIHATVFPWHGTRAASVDYIFLERLQFSGGVGCERVGSRMTLWAPRSQLMKFNYTLLILMNSLITNG